MVISSTLSNPVFFLKTESNRCQTVLFQNHLRSRAKTADIWVPAISNSNVVDFWSCLTILCETAVKKLIQITCGLQITLPHSRREWCQNEPLQLMERVCRTAQDMLWDLCVYRETEAADHHNEEFLVSFFFFNWQRRSKDFYRPGVLKMIYRDSWGPPRPFQKIQQVKTIFIIILKYYLLLSLYWHFTQLFKSNFWQIPAVISKGTKL